MNNQNDTKAPFIVNLNIVIFYVAAYGGALFLLAAIVFFVFLLINKGNQVLYYFTASSSTIGFGLMSLAFSLNSIMKKNNERIQRRSEKAEDMLTKYNSAVSKKEWILLTCVAEDFKKSAAIDCSLSLQKSKSEYALYVVKQIDDIISKKGVSFVTYLLSILQPPFTAIYGAQSGTNNPLELTEKLNWALGEMEPICYSYVNDEYEGQIFEENVREEFTLIYTLYIIVRHYRYFDRQTNFIELALFDAQ